jgi:protein TonB
VLALGGSRTIQPIVPLDEASFPPPPEPPPGQPDIQPPPVIGGRVETAALVEQTTPVYPALARKAHVEGVVVLEGTITVKGRVAELRVVSGHPMLVDAAIDAVKKWKYRPAKLNGQIIPCPVTVQVRFKLQYPQG